MASVRKRRGSRGSISYQVQVSRRGYKRSGSFSSHDAAKTWGREAEREIDRAVAEGRPPSWERVEPEVYPTLDEALGRYAAEVAPHKREGETEQRRIRAIRGRYIAGYRLDEIRPHHIAEYRDWRLESVKANTARLDLATISHLYTVAIQEWGWESLENPCAKVANPRTPPPHERRLTPGEETALIVACRGSGNRFLLPALLLSLEMAVRRAELCRLRWSQTDLKNRVSWLRVGDSKNSEYRAVPLTSRAVQVIESLPQAPHDDRLLQTTYRALVEAWKRARRRAGIQDYRWHDLRHEATSRLFEAGLNMMEAASVTGHKNPTILRRYTHLQPSELASKLDRAKGGSQG